MSSSQQLLVAAIALVAAWIPAATIAAPTADQQAPYVVEATRVLPRQAPVCREAVDREERRCSSAHL